MRNQSKPFGFNVIGFATGNLGLGVAARSAIDLIRRRGFPVHIVDLDPGLGRGGHEATYQGASISAASSLPYAVNLCVTAPRSLSGVFASAEDILFDGSHLNAALPFWELPGLPMDAVKELSRMDVVVGVSHSMRAAYEFALSGPAVVPGLLPISLPGGVVADRQRFGLSPDACLFVTGFEPHSDVQRKNPHAAIQAFRTAFGDRPDVALVMRVNNAADGMGRHRALTELEALCAGVTNIQLVDAPLDYAGVLSLYASCDVYVSLHRAEGLGLAPLEAMLLGKPVIATAWSGNMTYMNHTNSCPVPYSLVPLNASVSAYRDELLQATARWAEPDLGHASSWMSKLVADANMRDAMGRAAHISANAFNEDAQKGRFVDELHAIWQSGRFLPERRTSAAVPVDLHLALSVQEDRIRHLESQIQWLETRLHYRIARKVRQLFARPA